MKEKALEFVKPVHTETERGGLLAGKMQDNRETFSFQSELHQLANDSPRVALQGKFFSESINSENTSGKENLTGIPDTLRAGLEHCSGLDLSDVRVHYNSQEPAKVGALAFARGNAIHLHSGQEKHLPHEGWHVVQQKQGRVKPSMKVNDVPVNDDISLEREADIMGKQSLAFSGTADEVAQREKGGPGHEVVQRREDPLTDEDVGGLFIISLGGRAFIAIFEEIDERGIHMFKDAMGGDVGVQHAAIGNEVPGEMIYHIDLDMWIYDDDAHTLSRNVTLIQNNVATIDSAREIMLETFRNRTNTPQYPAEQPNVNITGQDEAQMLDYDSEDEILVDDGITFDGEAIRTNITGGGSVSSAGASTCVIVIMTGTIVDQLYAVCRHFTAGTDHFDNIATYLDEMKALLQGAEDISVYAVGGVAGADQDMQEDHLALAEALESYAVEVFKVPAFNEDDSPNISSVEASYSAQGFRWKYELNED